MVGTPVTFRITAGNGKYSKAVDVRMADPPVLPEHEISVIDVWKAEFNHGFGHREQCGCSIYVGMEYVISEGIESLRAGSRLIHRVFPTRYHRDSIKSSHFTAYDVEIFKAD